MQAPSGFTPRQPRLSCVAFRDGDLMHKQFYVYIHKKPDGMPFYVGKGTGNRAYQFSKRTQWHKNIVAKYGKENIIIELVQCVDEKSAFDLERIYIKQLRESGVELVNLTDGGEGASGLVRGSQTETHKKKNANAKRGNTFRRGSTHTPESIQKMRDSHVGKRMTDEQKKNYSLRKVGVAHKNRGSGLAGVNWMKHMQKWRVQTTIFGKTSIHGYYENFLDAAAKRIALQKKITVI